MAFYFILHSGSFRFHSFVNGIGAAFGKSHNGGCLGGVHAAVHHGIQALRFLGMGFLPGGTPPVLAVGLGVVPVAGGDLFLGQTQRVDHILRGAGMQLGHQRQIVAAGPVGPQHIRLGQFGLTHGGHLG